MTLTDAQIRELALPLPQIIKAFFDDPENQAAFDEWRAAKVAGKSKES